MGDVGRGSQAGGGGGAELEDSDESVPEHDGRQDDAVEAAACEKAGDRFMLGRVGSVDGEDHGRTARHGAGRRWVLAELPPAAPVDRVPAAIAGRERGGAVAVDPVDRTGVEARPCAQCSESGQDERFRVHRRRVHAESGDEIVQLLDTPCEDGGVVIPGQGERRRCRRRLDQRVLLAIRRPGCVLAVDLEETDHVVAEVDRRGIHALRATLVAADQVGSNRLDRGQVADQHGLAGRERGGDRAEVRDGVEEATQRRSIAGRRGGHRLEGLGLAVVTEDVAGDGAQFMAQPGGQGEQQVLRPRRGRRLVGEDAVGQDVAQLVVRGGSIVVGEQASRLAGHELGEGHIGAGEGARRSRLHELEHRAVPAADCERDGEDGGVSALSQCLRLRPLEQVRRSQIGDDESPSGLEHFPYRRQRSPREAFVFGGGAVAGPAACSEDRERVVSLGQRDPAGGHSDTLGRHARQSEQLRAPIAGDLRGRRDGRRVS